MSAEQNVVAFKRDSEVRVFVDDEARNVQADEHGLMTFRYAYNVPELGYIRMGNVRSQSRSQAVLMIMRLCSNHGRVAIPVDRLREIFK